MLGLELTGSSGFGLGSLRLSSVLLGKEALPLGFQLDGLGGVELSLGLGSSFLISFGVSLEESHLFVVKSLFGGSISSSLLFVEELQISLGLLFGNLLLQLGLFNLCLHRVEFLLSHVSFSLSLESGQVVLNLGHIDPCSL